MDGAVYRARGEGSGARGARGEGRGARPDALFEEGNQAWESGGKGRGEALLQGVGIFDFDGKDAGFARHREMQFPTEGEHFGNAEEMGRTARNQLHLVNLQLVHVAGFGVTGLNRIHDDQLVVIGDEIQQCQTGFSALKNGDIGFNPDGPHPCPLPLRRARGIGAVGQAVAQGLGQAQTDGVIAQQVVAQAKDEEAGGKQLIRLCLTSAFAKATADRSARRGVEG